MIDDKDFPREAALFLAQLTPDQRVNLAAMAQSYGKKADAGAQDRRPMAKDSRGLESAAAGESFNDRFPHYNRLKKSL